MEQHPTEDGADRARDRTDAVEVSERDLERHCLSGPIYILKSAQPVVERLGLEHILRWFNAPRPALLVGETHSIEETGLQAFFGFDQDKPNGKCFFVNVYSNTP